MALFEKHRIAQTEKLLESISSSQRADMLVLRGNNCQILFINSLAKGRLSGVAAYEATCKNGYGTRFPSLCSICANFEKEPNNPHFTADVEDVDGRTFKASYSRFDWLDERPATAIVLRDVTEDIAVQKKLYSLAYVDQLTGVPNRQKFKEDFDKLAPHIENGSKVGVVCIFDLDNFKNVNDNYGHATGDILLYRLTEHFQTDDDFKGHIYRLGGDEFVLLYAEPANRFTCDVDLQEHYNKLLQRSFLAYTMPNIEISCTISMGVSFFPRHGQTASELLRRADIALYKAKEGGRNRKIFFEDHFDTAKKFKDFYISMQPILTALGRTYGYELTDAGDGITTDENALSLADFDRTMDALGIGEIDDSSRYFIHFSNQLLSATVLNNLPKDKFVIEVPASSACSENILQKYRELKANGYSLALCGITDVPLPPDLLALVDFCKFLPEYMNSPVQKKLMQENPGKRFIAASVDDEVAFNAAEKNGFKLFQGFFFSQPVVVKKDKDVDPMKENYLRLLQLTGTDDFVDFSEISYVISCDVALSYKLLRLLNSAAVGLRNPISSIEMAVAYLGEEHLKKWVALLALRGVAQDKPLELVRMSLVRAQFGALLAPYFIPSLNEKHVFLVGMFSLLHIALEKTKEELFDEIPVADSIRLSLTTSTGPYSSLASFFSQYEYGNWSEVASFAQEHRISDKIIRDCYIAALTWYNSLLET